ncbi:MAG TPA: hypothetical protein VLH59_01710 [Ignavibacteriaceae bacterium]|nr:hypothetical protein [Ignavibacteriaceae bacterium]
MGQQQLLLIVLGVIIVGVAVLLSLGLFKANAVEQKRDLMISESANIAIHAITYYKKPREYSGGGNSFFGWEIPAPLTDTEAGSYNANVTANLITITGTGTEVVTGTDSIKVETVVTANEFYTEIIF